MQITKLPFDPKCISMSVERAAVRSSGIHLSSIIKDRLITAGVSRKTVGRPFTREEQHLLFERGFLWERMVAEFTETQEWISRQIDEAASQHFAAGFAETDRVLIRPGECMMDGIYMTPDALNMAEYAIEEYKATAIRAKNFDIEARRQEWLWQACSYAKVFGMNKAIFRIWHVSDNCITPILVEWTHEEVDENWRQIREHYEFMQSRGGK